MVKFLDKYILNPLTFKSLILVVLFLAQIPFVHIVIGGYIKFLLLLGIIICIWDIIKHNGISKLADKAYVLLIVFVVLYSVTIVINRDLYFSENIKQLVYMAVFFWLFFMVGEEVNLHYDMKVVSWIIVSITFILSFASLITYFLNITEFYYNTSDLFINYIGVPSGRLFGFYNSNSCGSIAMISLLVSLFLVFENKANNKIKYCLSIGCLILNIVIQFVTLLLSGSRSSYYSFLIVVALIIFIAIIKNTRYNQWIRVLLAISLSALAFVCVIKFSDFVQMNMPNWILVSDEDANDIEKDTSFENALESFLIKYYDVTSAQTGLIKLSLSDSLLAGVGREDNAEIISDTGRIDIWKAGIKVFQSAPLFGVTREGLVDKVSVIFDDQFGTVASGGLHNIYLTILVSSGIVGFITIAFVVILVLIKFLKFLLLNNHINNYLLFSFAMVLIFLISEFVENRILYQAVAYNAVFWIYFGYFYKELKDGTITKRDSTDI